MEIVQTKEDEMVLECLEKMLSRAQGLSEDSDQGDSHSLWQQHMKVISRAIDSTKSNMLHNGMY